MNGKRTAMILGAGASHCYEDGTGPLPLQSQIVGNIGGLSASSGSPCEFAGPAGITHSPELAEAISQIYSIDPGTGPAVSTSALWEELRNRKETMESVYAKLEHGGARRELLDDFSAIARTSVRQPVPSRGLENVCRHHRALAESLEPGDYVISFNWDSLMADALVHCCPFWYPRTGFGFDGIRGATKLRQKGMAITSLVQLYQIHGSVVLFERLTGDPASAGTGEFLYLGPPYSGIDGAGMIAVIEGRKSDPDPEARRTLSEMNAINRGYLFTQGRWFRPVFVPPSLAKGEYSHRYHRALRTLIHTNLPVTERFLIVGYSFPIADESHLGNIFNPGAINREAEGVVVNPSCPDAEYQKRVQATFPSISHWDFDHTDLKAFTATLDKYRPAE